MTQPRISKEIVSDYAKRYEKKWSKDTELEDEFFEWFKKHRYLNKKMFIRLGRWKTKRQTKNYLKNSEYFINKVTRDALAVKDDVHSDRVRSQPFGNVFAGGAEAGRSR